MFSLQLIITLLLFSASAAGVYWGVLPKWTLIQDNRAQIQAVDNATAVAKSQLDQIKAAISSYEGLERSVKDRVLSSLPASTDTANAIATFDRIITESGLAVSIISLLEKQEPVSPSSSLQAAPAMAALQQQSSAATQSNLQNISFGITAAGDYASIKHLVLNLENLLRLNDIDSFAITHVKPEQSESSQVEQDFDKLEVKIRGTVYSMPSGPDEAP